MLTLTLFLIFCTVALSAYMIVPAVSRQLTVASERREQKISLNMEKVMTRQEAKKMSRLLIFAPLAAALLLYCIFPKELNLFGAILGLVLGFVFPSIYIQYLTKKTKEKFSDQLVDALMIMSSSFRGGLSLIQALEAIVEEMPDPINQEISTVLGENKMGVSLEEALNHLYNRLPSPALQQMITAILLARETGGNLPVIFTRIVNTIREHKKIQQNLDTLTIQGKIQGVVMILLPIGFTCVVYSANRRIFDHMLHSDMGKTMLVAATILEIVGGFLIWKISTFKDY